MTLRALVFIAVGILLGWGCSDRVVVDDPERDEEVEACEAFVAWAEGCDLERSVGRCLEQYFSDRLEPCRDVALNRTRCFAEQSCTDDLVTACRYVTYPFDVCNADPQLWEQYGCDASKCPGECCRGREPCQGVDANCPWYKPVCNDQTGLCMEAP